MQQKYESSTIDKLKNKSKELRVMTLDMCEEAGTGHVTSSYSCAETLAVLYHGNIIRYDAKNPKWDDRDRFILSKGQASPILYVTLADAGFFPKSWLSTFAKKDGKFGVHLQNTVPGVEVSTGSLGHGLGLGIGMAFAAKLDKKDYITFVLLGDGECYEGSIWEGALFAAHHNLNNLIVIVDRNGQCATSFTENAVKLNPLEDKWKSFGWDVKTIDGHSVEEFLNALEGFRSRKRNNPYVIIAETIKGKGSPLIESKVNWHAKAPNHQEAQIIKKDLGD